MYIHIYVHTYVCVYIYTHICTSLHTNINVDACVHVFENIYIHIYTYLYTRCPNKRSKPEGGSNEAPWVNVVPSRACQVHQVDPRLARRGARKVPQSRRRRLSKRKGPNCTLKICEISAFLSSSWRFWALFYILVWSRQANHYLPVSFFGFG